MTVTGIQKPPPAAAPAARQASSAARLAWLHLRSRRVPAALVALLTCGVALWASLHYHWGLGTRNVADELPMILQGCAAGIIAVTTHSPFGEPERATGWRLAVLRTGLVLALCGAAIGLFALGAAVAYSPQSGVHLAWRHPRGRAQRPGNDRDRADLLPGDRRADRLDRPARLHGHLSVRPDRELLLAAHLALPWPPTDRGGWIAAMAVFAVGLISFTVRGPRVRQSGELRPADGQRFRASPRPPTTAHRRPAPPSPALAGKGRQQRAAS